MVTLTVRLRACSASCIALSRAFSCALSCQAHKLLTIEAHQNIVLWSIWA